MKQDIKMSKIVEIRNGHLIVNCQLSIVNCQFENVIFKL
ncbi:hypothetical protein M2133_002627 [Parabacteroides sp. PF5-6]|nr:hypothetical protein [Parabacteroides sp. PF5-6]